MTYTIAQATEVFAHLDRTDKDNRAATDKLLRNLTQRHYFSPVGRSGRADVYDIEMICSLRLVQKASVFGLDRWQIETLTRFLNQAPRTKPGRTKTIIAEAVERVTAGETFGLALVMYADGRFVAETDWQTTTPEQDAKIDAIFDSAGVTLGMEDCRFGLNASRLIADVLTELMGAKG